MTFNDLADTYFEMHQSLMKPSSYANSIRLYQLHIKDQFGNTDVESINSRSLQKFYNELSQKPKKTDPSETLADSTIRDIVGLVKTICYDAMREGDIREFKFQLRRPYNIRETEQTQNEYLHENHYQTLMQACTDKDYRHYGAAKVMAALALTTGLRIGEICGLQWADVDFNTKTISVRRTVQRICNADGGSYVYVGQPKSKTSKRTVVMVDNVCELLKVFYGYRDPPTLQCFVIGSETPTEPRTIRASYKRLLDRLGIPYIHPHALRHTFCTYSLANGCDVKVVSELLGHSDTHITLDVYAHVTQRQKKETVQKLNDIYNLERKISP